MKTPTSWVVTGFQSGISWHGVMKAILNLKREIMIFYSLKQCYGNNHNFAQMCLMIGTVSQVSDVAHGPLVDSRVKNQSIVVIICNVALLWTHLGSFGDPLGHSGLCIVHLIHTHLQYPPPTQILHQRPG